MFGSIRHQIAWMICILVVIALAGLFCLTYSLLSQDYEQRMLENNSVMADSLAANIAQMIENAYNINRFIARYLDLPQLNGVDQKRILQDTVKQYPFFDVLALHDISGQQLARSSGMLANRSDSWWFKRFMDTKEPFISQTYFSVTTGRPVTTIVQGVYRDSVLTGVLMTDIATDMLQRMVENYNSGAGSYAYLLDQAGVVIAHPDKSQVRELYNYKTMTKEMVQRDAAGNVISHVGGSGAPGNAAFAVEPQLHDFVLKVMEGQSGVGIYTADDGKKYICAYRPVLLPGTFDTWSLIVIQERSAVMAFVYGLIGKIALSGLLVAGLAALAALLFSRRFVRPLTRIVSATEKITGGDLAERLPDTRHDEFGILAVNFNRMVEELQRHRTNLEALVASRTAELDGANQELVAVNEELSDANNRLHAENEARRHTEANLMRRERQYQAIAALLTGPSGGDDIFHVILQNAVQILNAAAGYIGKYSSDGMSYTVKHSIGLCGDGSLRQVHSGMQHHVYETGELYYVEDYRCYPDRVEHPWIGDNATTVIMVPLRLGGQLVGSMAVSWNDEIHAVSADELAAMRKFGDLASVALERTENNKKISRMAYYDSLTGLPNRAYLKDYLTEEVSRAGHGTSQGLVLFIDIDNFKSVNDNFGHRFGDSFIVTVSRRIVAAAGDSAFVARLGGDEFIVIVPGLATTEDAAGIAGRIIDNVCTEYSVSVGHFYMSASIGVVRYPADAETVEEIMQKADNAMYAAKKAGRNCWRFYEASMLEKSHEDMLLMNGLRHGLERGEFSLCYQPQFTVDGSRIVGFEALLRWDSAAFGRIPPARFIPLVEQNELILMLGKWVMREACSFVKKLTTAGRQDIRVAVNISPRQLNDDDFVQWVSAAISDNGILPSQLECELTESMLIESVDSSIAKLRRLRDIGVVLTLDDFGTGYSSLTYLQSLPVDVLKIDKAFIDHITEDDIQSKLVGYIIALGHTLGMRVVAEGAESDRQQALLAELHCDYIQGYVFSRPVPEKTALEMLIAGGNEH